VRASVVAALAAALALAAAAGRAEASDGAAPVCVGPKGPVSVPIDGDAQSIFRMPSSVAWSTQHRADLDFFLFNPITTVRNTLNDFRQDSLGFGATGGVVLSLDAPDLYERSEKEKPRRLVFGLGEYVDMGGASGDSTLRSTTYPEGKATQTGILFLTTSFTVAWSPFDWLGLGASFHFIYTTLDVKSLIGGGTASLNGSPKINGVPLPGNPTYTDFINLFRSGPGSDPATYVTTNLRSFQFDGVFSVSIRPVETFGLGVAYQPRSIGPDYSGDATVDATRTVSTALGPLDPVIQKLFLATLPNGGQAGFISKYHIAVSGLVVPQTVRASVAWWPTSRLLLGAEVAWYDWLHALAPKAVLSGGTNADIRFMVGSDTITDHIKVRWSSEFAYSGYASFGVTDQLTARLGFNYTRVPINPNTIGNGPNAAIASTTVTVGAGFRPLESLEVNALFEHSFYQSLKSDLSPDGVTAKNTSYSARQFLVHVGVGYDF
jgi:long-subunit fatty acid transport protein